MIAHSRVLALLLLTTTACAKPSPEPTSEPAPAETTATPAEAEPEPGTTQIANPASENCIAKGGKLDIVDGPDGQYGMCTLPDGTQCEEWALMRGECQACAPCPQLAPPAPDFCKGGTIVPGPKDACGCQAPPTCEKPGLKK